MDFLRTIFPFLYAFIPFLAGITLMYWALKRMFPSLRPIFKKVYLVLGGIATVIFLVAVIRMAAVNEIPENELDNSVKKERSNYSVEKAKKDTVTIK